MKRGAYFFVLDAFIAGVIIISSLVIAFTTFATEESPNQNIALAEDFISFLETTTIAEYGGDIAFTLRTDGDITDASVTLLEQLAIFHEDPVDRTANTTALLTEISELAPPNAGIGFLITQAGVTTPLYNQSPDGITFANARVQLTAQRVVAVRGAETLTPYVVEVRLWR